MRNMKRFTSKLALVLLSIAAGLCQAQTWYGGISGGRSTWSHNSTDLSGAVMYASGYPCSMCYTAMLLAGVKQVYFAYSNEDGEPYDLSAARGYEELARPEGRRELPVIGHRVRDAGEDLYQAWQKAVDEDRATV